MMPNIICKSSFVVFLWPKLSSKLRRHNSAAGIETGVRAGQRRSGHDRQGRLTLS